MVLVDEFLNELDYTGEETNPVVVLGQADSCPRTFSSLEIEKLDTNPFLTKIEPETISLFVLGKLFVEPRWGKNIVF